jgi:FHA domain
MLSRFATSCGAFAPLEIAVEYLDGQLAATGLLTQPFALIGSDSSCDICLSIEDIDPFAVFLQSIGGQVFVGDLGTRSGIHWPYGRHVYGWMNPDEPIRIGAFQLRLQSPLSPHPAPFGPAFHPLVAGPDVPTGLPPVEIEFRTGMSDRSRWSVNRVLTLIGSNPDCKIHLNAADVAPRHCYLVHTHDGLWVVNLALDNTIYVNGDSVRFARLGEDDELTVGQFVIACTYPNPMDDDGIVCFDDFPRSPTKVPSHQSSTRSTRRPPGFDFESPPLAAVNRVATKTDFDAELPPPQANDPQPADWNTDEPTDNPAWSSLSAAERNGHKQSGPTEQIPYTYEPSVVELLGGNDLPADDSGLIPTEELQTSVPPTLYPLNRTPAPIQNANPLALAAFAQPAIHLPAGTEGMMPVLRQLGEMQGHMFSQFQQSLTMMMQMFGQMHREQMGAVQQELARMGEVSSELAKLQSEMLKSKEAPPSPSSEPSQPETEPYVNHLPTPEDLVGTTEETAQQHDWVWQRMNQLNEERQSIWQRISGMLNSKSNGGAV